MYRKTIILTALLLALSLVFVFQETRQVRRNTIEVATLPEGVDRVTITQGEAELLLRRDGGSWLVGSQGYPASEEAIADFLDAVSTVQEGEVISARANYSEYGLTGAEAFDVSFEQEGTEVLTLTLGSNAAAGNAVYARINERPQVVLMPQRLRDLASVDSTEFRNRRMASIDQASVESALIDGAVYGPLTLRRIPEPEVPEDATEVERLAAGWEVEGPEEVDPGRIRNFLREVGDLRAEDFSESEPQGAPFATVSVTTTGGEERFSLYPPTENDLYPATATTSQYAFLIPEWRARRLLLGTPQFFEQFEEATPGE